ncbi:hypothetical protein ACH5RR_012305 [Cinchona calisaya]|uniref:Cytochrome P450 n=1 Tax=Cinchona calisaya TaxID=153742 RepID=A0ABD3A7G0_9GENT
MNLPPSPPKLPIIGNLHQLSKLPHQNLYQLSQKYGPVMLLQLGYTPTLVISSAEMAKEILQTHDIDFCSRPNSPAVKKFFYNFSDVAFSPYTDHLRERRKIFVSHLLNSKRIQSFWKAREAEINHLIESISVVCEKPVNLDEKMFDLVDGVITTVAFGKSYRGKQFEGKF